MNNEIRYALTGFTEAIELYVNNPTRFEDLDFLEEWTTEAFNAMLQEVAWDVHEHPYDGGHPLF